MSASSLHQSLYRVAAVQTVSGPEVEANLREIGMLIAQAADLGARLVALPEYFAVISPDEQAKVRIREREGSGPLQDFLREAAVRHGIWLIGGTVPLVSNDATKVRNATLVYDDQGVQVARYDKIHLFGFRRGEEHYEESATIEPGNEVVSFDAPFGRVGML